MPLGDILYSTVGYTQTDGASKRKGYPIKKKYKQTENVQQPRFPASYTLISDTLYWMPFLNVPIEDSNFIPYTAGDEYGWSDDQNERAPTIPYSNPKTTKYDDFPIDHKIVFGDELYVATRYTFDWGSTKFDISINPYKTSIIRKWKKFNDDSQNWTQYWYHPLLNRFLLLENIDAIQELPDFDEPLQSRWDKFKGDAQDMNLKNFDFAQIQLLISTGYSKTAAELLVSSIEEKANTFVPLATVPNDPRFINGTRTGSITSGSFVVAQKSSSGSGSLPPVPDSFPQMIQRVATVRPGEKTVVDTYIFNLRPNNVSYSNIGVTWSEVDRVNNFPLVDYRNNKLMKINFEFVVEAQKVLVSSLYESCEERLQILRRMANRPELVVFTNFDSLFTEAAALSATQANYREWAIVEMSFNSIQRTPPGKDSEVGSISRATVNMTIQEVRLTTDNAIYMPKLNKVAGKVTKRNKNGDPETCREVATDSIADRSGGKIQYSTCWYKNSRISIPPNVLDNV